MKAKLRVGVVGHGYFGAFHARHYAANPNVDLVGIADPRPGLDVGGQRLVRDHRQLIGLVDAVSIAAPTALHHGVASDFIAAGVHVLVEKPLADTSDRARDLADRADLAGVVLRVGHIERFSPAYVALRETVASPRLIECTRHTLWSGRATDVDVILDLMIHDIDLVLDLVRSEPVAVDAAGVAAMGRGLDAVTARVAFASGAVANISASRIAPTPTRTLVVHESNRVLAADLGARTAVSFEAASATRTPLATIAQDALGAEIAAFLAAVLGEPSRGVGGTDAARAVALAERIGAAARRRPVSPLAAGAI